MKKGIKGFVICLVVLSFMLTISDVQAYEPQVHDFEGEEVVIAGTNQDGPEEGDEMYDRVKQVEEDFNVEIEFVKDTDAGDKVLSGVMAGDSPYDLVQLEDYTLAANNALYPIGELLGDDLDDFYESLPDPYQGRDGFKELVSLKGQAYGLPVQFGLYTNAVMIAWNPELLENEGLPSIYELMDNNQWTWEKFTEIAIELTSDTDGDGEIDQFGIAGMGFGTNAFYHMLATNDAYLTKNEDGKIVYALDEGGKAEYVLEKMHEITDHGAILGGWPGWDQFHDGNVGMWIGPLWAMNNTKNDNFDQGLAYLPVGSDAEDFVFGTVQPQYMAIPVTSERPEELTDLWLTLNPLEEQIEEDVQERLEAAADEKGFELLNNMINNYKIITKFRSLIDAKMQFHMQQALQGDVKPSTALSEFEPKFQAALDDLLDQ